METEIQGLDSLKRKETLTAVRIPMFKTSQFLIKLAPYLLNQDYTANVIQDPSGAFTSRLVLLNKLVDENLSGFPEDLKKWLEEEKVEIFKHEIVIDHNSYSQDQLLKKILPSNLNTNIKSESLQDIRILELEPEQEKHKSLIGKIVQMKSQDMSKAVLMRKATSLHEERPTYEWGKYFLDFQFEVLAGNVDLNKNFKEGNSEFELNLNEAHYYSFLQTERDRLTTTFNKDSVFADMFGDVITSIRVALNNVTVLANCMNDEKVYKTFLRNLELPLNKNAKQRVHIFNEDLPQFLVRILKPEKSDLPKIVKNLFSGRIVNDIKFIHEFVGLFSAVGNSEYVSEENLPVLHFYYLASNQDFTESMKRVLSTKLNTENRELSEAMTQAGVTELFNPEDILEIFIVDGRFHGENRLLHVALRLSAKVAFFDKYTSQLAKKVQQLVHANGHHAPSKKSNEKSVEDLENETRTTNNNEGTQHSPKKIKKSG